MQVLFLIPRNPPPVLDERFSKPFRDFLALCLQRDPNAVSYDDPFPARDKTRTDKASGYRGLLRGSCSSIDLSVPQSERNTSLSLSTNPDPIQ
jgi:hypothetical protein